MMLIRYTVDPTLLIVGENSVAVQVKSPGSQSNLRPALEWITVVFAMAHTELSITGGKAGSPMPGASPGGICDTGATSVNGVSVATGADWNPPSAFDAARYTWNIFLPVLQVNSIRWLLRSHSSQPRGN